VTTGAFLRYKPTATPAPARAMSTMVASGHVETSPPKPNVQLPTIVASNIAPQAAQPGLLSSSAPSVFWGSGSSLLAHFPAAVTNASPELRYFCAIVQTVAQAVQHMGLYQCQEVLAVIGVLPLVHRSTGFVLALEARAYFEQARYSQACDVYSRLQRLEPWRCEGLAYFSSALWHLRRDTDLAALAKSAQALHRHAADACLAAGNCFSLQKDHEAALKIFRKAVQADSQCAYAHTLAAHEHAASDDFDKAVIGYRNALRIDDRHYNAWYGLGNVLFRQEKFQLAVVHFQRAIQIHPSSSVLHCYLGMLLNSCGKYDAAVASLMRAVELEPHPSQARFQLANVYLGMERYDDALRELQTVRMHVPREAAIHFLIGKIYRQLGERTNALKHLVRCRIIYFLYHLSIYTAPCDPVCHLVP
jgi:anaphase-promoting complex subunit 3